LTVWGRGGRATLTAPNRSWAITIYNRFNRWSRQRILFEIIERLTESGRITATVAIESWTIKVHRSAGSETGALRRVEQAIGRWRGGRTTKIHVLRDAKG
jgi:hypothetical protein